jgi:cytochrome c peroxidase
MRAPELRVAAAAALAVAAILAAAHVDSPGNGARSGGFDARAVRRIESPPIGLPQVPIPPDNPPTAAKIRLGRKLFLDRRLSRNGTLSCAMCHVPEQGFTVNELRTAVGFEGKSLRRNASTLLNVAYVGPLFHDGREPTLEMQPFDVFLNPDEMAAPSLGAVVAAVGALPDYPPLFRAAFGAPPSAERIGAALATYVRSLVSGGSPFDRWRYGGEPGALGTAARRGFDLFAGRAGCVGCHAIGERSALFTDNRFHDTGVAWYQTEILRNGTEEVRVELAPDVTTVLPHAAVVSVGAPPPADLGRYEVTGDPADRWRIRTPTLRNVALTAPYMHDGSFSTLGEVVAFYDRGALPHEGLDPALRPLGLGEGERDDLVEFLKSLTGGNIDELIRDVRSEAVGDPGGARD